MKPFKHKISTNSHSYGLRVGRLILETIDLDDWYKVRRYLYNGIRDSMRFVPQRRKLEWLDY